MMRVVGIALGAALLGAVISGLAVYAIDGRGSSAPDRVVGIVTRCEVIPIGGSEKPVEISGSDCSSTGRFKLNPPVNVRLELTIRTAKGTSYTVDVSPQMPAHIGDPWPQP